MREKKYVLMAIKPQYARLIKEKEKTIELRKTLPKIQNEDIIVIYESSPIQMITAYCEVDGLLKADPSSLWANVYEQAGIGKDAYDSYFSNRDIAYGIKLKNIHILKIARKLSELSEDLSAPQSYRYLDKTHFIKLQERNE